MASNDRLLQDPQLQAMPTNGFSWNAFIRQLGFYILNQEAGQVTLASGTATVTFAHQQKDTGYYVSFSSDTAGETFEWASKTEAGFTVNSSNGSSTAKVDWLISR